MTEIAYLFPGQGSQEVGMGRDWVDAHAAARRTFEEADDALAELLPDDKTLSELCFEGPDDELQLTANTQPAILACSVAMYRVLAEKGLPEPKAVAGHSLGEYSALVAAGSLDFADALRLVRERGELMQQAVPVGAGAMAAIIGLDREPLEEILDEVDVADATGTPEIAVLANVNSPQQLVIAGHHAAVERAAERAKEAGAKMAKMLPVSAPFHSPLMKPAREGLAPRLEETEFRDPEVPVICNIDAAPVTDGDAARDALVRQIDGPVRWVESVRHMIDEMGIGTFAEIGPGKVLFGLGRRIDRGPTWIAPPAAAGVDEFLAQLAE